MPTTETLSGNQPQASSQCICQICTCGNHSCRHNNLGGVGPAQHNVNQSRSQIPTEFQFDETSGQFITKSSSECREHINSLNQMSNIHSNSSILESQKTFNIDSSETDFNNSSNQCMFNRDGSELRERMRVDDTRSLDQGHVEIMELNNDMNTLNSSKRDDFVGGASYSASWEAEGSYTPENGLQTSSKSQSQFNSQTQKGQRLVRGSTVTKKVFKDGKWETVEYVEDNSDSVVDRGSVNGQRRDSSSSHLIQNSMDSSTSTKRSSAAVIEIDKKTGQRILRQPPTRQRVLKGGKWEIIEVPGEIISETESTSEFETISRENNGFSRDSRRQSKDSTSYMEEVQQTRRSVDRGLSQNSEDTTTTTTTTSTVKNLQGRTAPPTTPAIGRGGPVLLETDLDAYDDEYTRLTTKYLRNNNRDVHQFRGTNVETVTGGTKHDFGDVQGLTVYTHSKSSMGTTEDQLRAQNSLQNLQNSKVYGVDYENSLRTAGVKNVEEREISNGRVKISNNGVETSENVEKSITEIKASDVNRVGVEVAEKIRSTTRSSDKQTFRFEEMQQQQVEEQVVTSNSQRKAGQAMVEDTYDVKTTFESRDRDNTRPLGVAVQDESFKTTTYLEKVENDKANNGKDTSYLVYPRVAPIRQVDNLKMEGTTEFGTTNMSQFDERRATITTTRREEMIKQKENLKPEGEFYGKRHSLPVTKTDRVAPIKHEDNLRPEGDFYDRPRIQEWIKGDRAEKVLHEDNLHMEGTFEKTTVNRDMFKNVKGERVDAIRPEDNLKPEGEFYKPAKPDQQAPAERRKPIVKSDNLRPEGDFVREKERMPVLKPERSQPIKQKDNLKPEGEFYKTPKEQFIPGEKSVPVKQLDNLFPEGKFYGEKEKMPVPVTNGNRTVPVKAEDNLRPEGDFHDTRKSTVWVKGERAEKVVHEDNIKMEGTFDRSTTNRDDFQHVPKGDRMDIVKPSDNLRPEGEFYQRPKEQFIPVVEKSQPIIQNGNLKPEGLFYGEKEKMPVHKPEKAQPIKHPDQLKPEGEFPKREKVPYVPGQRSQPIVQQDNLKPEGKFHGEREKMPISPKTDRTVPIRHQDNLRPEVEDKPKNVALVKGERPDKVVPEDNVGMRGEYREETTTEEEFQQFVTGQRPGGVKPQGINVKPEGEFPKRDKPNSTPVDKTQLPRYSPERTVPIRQPNQANMKPTGPNNLDRMVPITPDLDNLGPDDNLLYDKPVNGENIKIKGEFRKETSIEEEFQNFLKGERYEVKKPVDNLQVGMTGEFHETTVNREMFRSFSGEDQSVPLERAKPIIQSDNLRPEGKFLGEKDKMPEFKPEKSLPIKQPDNLRPEGEFTGRRKDTVVVKGERAEKIVQKDTLKMEGEFETRTMAQEEFRSYTKGDRADVVKHQDNLRMEGELSLGTSSMDDFQPRNAHCQRLQMIRPKDNLTVAASGEAPILRPNFIYGRPSQLPVPISGSSLRYEMKRHETTLRLEGNHEFASSHRRFYSLPRTRSGARSLPIRPQDNLHLQGEHKFEDRGRSRSRATTPLFGDRAPVKIPQDNLRLHGEHRFDSRPPSRAPTPLGDRAIPIRPNDNLHLEGELKFDSRPASRATTPLFGDRAPVKIPKDNLRLQGELRFDSRPPSRAPTPLGDRAIPIRPNDNLYLEGELKFDSRPASRSATPLFGDRAPVRIPQDNLRLYGEHRFDSRPPSRAPTPLGDRAIPIRPNDNLHLEGELKFESRPGSRATTPLFGDRAPVKIPQDNLRLQGELRFDSRPPSRAPTPLGDRAVPIRPNDNLHLSGPHNFDSRPPSRATTPLFGDRAPIKKYEDNLKLEGAFHGFQRRNPMNDLGLSPRHLQRAAKDRRSLRMPRKNTSQITFDDYLSNNSAGDLFYRRGHMASAQYNRMGGRNQGGVEENVLRGERFDLKKPQDNLKLTGPLQVPDKTIIPIKGDRAPVVRHTDNLTVGQGSMSTETTTRTQQNSVVNRNTVNRQSANGNVRKQSSSQVVVAEDVGDGKFDKSVTAKRTTVEERNLNNGRMTMEKSVESSVRQSAETRSSVDRSLEQKIISQEMGAKSHLNQNMVLNDVNRQRQIVNSCSGSQLHGGGESMSAMEMVSSSSSESKNVQVHANKQGTREVQVMREVTVTKRSGSGGSRENTPGAKEMSPSPWTPMDNGMGNMVQNTRSSSMFQNQRRGSNFANGMNSSQVQMSSEERSSHQASSTRQVASSSQMQSSFMTSESSSSTVSPPIKMSPPRDIRNGSSIAIHSEGILNGNLRSSSEMMNRNGSHNIFSSGMDSTSQQATRRQLATSSQSSSSHHTTIQQSQKTVQQPQQAEVRLIAGKVQKVGRSDPFDSQTSSSSYGQFQREERIIPVRPVYNRQHSNISLGSYGESPFAV